MTDGAPSLMLRRRSVRAPFLADSYAAAIYGSIVAAALLSAFRDVHEPPVATAASLLATVVVFWLAHVWSQITGQRIYDGTSFTPGRAWEIARAAWPLVASGAAPAVVLLVGAAVGISDRGASSCALALCWIQLAGWGFAVGRRASDRWEYATLSALVNFLLGVAVVGLEAIVLH